MHPWKLSTIVKIVYPGVVIVVLYIIKYQQGSIMKIRNTLVGAFFNSGSFLNYNTYVNESLQRASTWNPTPSYLYVILSLSPWLSWKLIVCLSTEKLQSNCHAYVHAFSIHWIKGSNLWLGLNLREGVVNLGYWIPNNHLNCLHILMMFIPMTLFSLKSDSWIWNQLLVTEPVHAECSTPSASLYPLLLTYQILGMDFQRFQHFIFKFYMNEYHPVFCG